MPPDGVAPGSRPARRPAAPEGATGDTRPERRPANERLSLCGDKLIISAGVNTFDAPKRIKAELLPGLKVVILLSGRLRIRLDGQAEHEICGPAALVIRNPRQGLPRDQVFAPGIPIRYALVQMDDGIAGNGLIDLIESMEGDARPGGGGGAILLSCPAGRALQSLATQIISCPIQGAERELYLCGKALQLSALAVAQCVSSRHARHAVHLSSLEMESIYKARAILMDTMRSPPSLEELARQVGLNAHKLNRGFRQVFGSTVHGLLQEYRLEQAYKLLAGGEMSVSEIAYHVGYGAAHFATIFRERFGISPSRLR